MIGWHTGLSYKEFYLTLRKLLQLSAASVTDDAIRTAFKVVDRTGDGALSREEFSRFLRGKAAGADDDVPLARCLDPALRLAATQSALRRSERLGLLRRRLRAAIKRQGITLKAFFAEADSDGDGAWSAGEVEALVRGRLRTPPRAVSDADIALLFRELDTGGDDRLSAAELSRFLVDAPAHTPTSPKSSRSPSRRTDALASPKLRGRPDLRMGIVEGLVKGDHVVFEGIF